MSDLDSSAVATVAEWRAGIAGKILTPLVVFNAQAYVSLTDAATIAIDLSTGFNFTVTLNGNRILGFPTNPKVGQSGFIEIVQPSAGAKTLTFASGYKFDGGSSPTIDTGSSRKTALHYHVRNTGEIWISRPFFGVR